MPRCTAARSRLSHAQHTTSDRGHYTKGSDNAAHTHSSSATATHASHIPAGGRPGSSTSLSTILVPVLHSRTQPRAACSAAGDRRSHRRCPPAPHRRQHTAPPIVAEEIGAVDQTCEGRGGNANAIRRARAELSSPEARTRQASARARLIALGVELTARGGAGSSGMLIGSFGQQQGAGPRTGRAGELQKATAMHTVVSMRVMGQGQMRHREGVRKHAPRGGNAQMNPEDGLGQQTPIDRPAAPRQLSHLAAQKICAVRTCARWKGSAGHRSFFLTFSFERGLSVG